MADETQPRLAALFDARMLQAMMDDFHELTRIPMALIDLEGQVIVGAGWQDVCTRFHRVNPETCAYCIESDTVLTANIPAGEMRLYHCKNGMWDAATPVMVGSVKVGNLFTGQFFFDDEPVDVAFFRAQAQRYGFDELEYLGAVEAVPRLDRATVETGMRFLTNLSTMISQFSFTSAQLMRAERDARAALDAQIALVDDLGTQHNVLNAIMENTDAHLAFLDPDFNFVAVNSTYARGSGHTAEELFGRNHFDLFPNAENQAAFERARRTGETLEYWAKPFVFADQPWRGVTYWNWRLTSVKNSDGELAGFAFSLIDVTQTVREKAFGDAINRLNDVIHAHLDFDSILAEFLPQLAEVVGCEVVTVVIRFSDDDWRCREVFGLPDELKDRVFDCRDISEMIAGETGRRSIVAPQENPPELALELGIKSLAVAPLSLAGEQLGILACGYTSGPGEFDEDVMDFLGKIAASMSLALNNSRLFEHEHHIADRLQEAFLGLPAHIEGVEFARAYHSATEAARVGGDFFDIFDLGSRYVGIAIGDISGKGIDAAALTALVKYTLRAHASEKGRTPAEVLSRTNELVYRSTPTEVFATVFFAIMDREEERLLYASAGHTTCMIIRSDGVVTELPSTGPVLGGFSTCDCEGVVAEFGANDTLFLYTDGLIEARGEDGLYGEERLLALLSQMGGLATQDIVAETVADVMAFTGSLLRDDLAVLVVQRSRSDLEG